MEGFADLAHIKARRRLLTSTQLNAFTWHTLFTVHSVSANWSGLERVGPVTHPEAGLAAQAMFAGDSVEVVDPETLERSAGKMRRVIDQRPR